MMKVQWIFVNYATIVFRISGYGAAEVLIDLAEDKHTESG